MPDPSKQSSSADFEAGELSTLNQELSTALDDRCKKLEADHSVSKNKIDEIKYLKRTKNLFNKFASFETTEGDKKKKFRQQVSGTLRDLKGKIAENKPEEVHGLVSKLYPQMPSSDKLLSIFSEADRSSRGGKDVDSRQVETTCPYLHTDEIFKGSPTFRDLRVVYESLERRQTKLCFLSFAIIPENEVVKKRLMTSWWVGEGFVSRPTDGKSTNEEIADGILDELVKKGLIEPIYKKRRSVANSYKMNPLIRSVVIVLAEEARLFDFDEKLNPKADFQKSYRACLFKGSSRQLLKKDSAKEKPDSNADSQKRFRPWLGKGSSQQLLKKDSAKVKPDSNADSQKRFRPWLGQGSSEQLSKKDSQSGKHSPPQQLDKLQSIFNVSEPYPGFFESEWFSKLKNLKVLYLGATQSSAKRHVEVESVDFLKELKLMKHLRFFSLQGISRIMALPDSVYKLSNLRILDLRACHNLEELPNGIESLKKLTHLDLSECYLLDNIPKGVGKLPELQVLKGFVIGGSESANPCTLNDLSGLKQLRKLTIYTNQRCFPNDKEIRTLQSFEELQKLTIVWGAEATASSSSEKKQEKSEANNSPKKNEDQKKQDKIAAAAKPNVATTTNPTNIQGKKEQGNDATQPMAAATESPKKHDALEKQDNFAAEPSTATPINPKNSLDNKEQDREATRPVATTMNNGDQEKQEKVEAEPKSATTTNPTNSRDNKERDKDAPQPVATPINSPKKNGDQEKQEKVEAEPKSATTTNPTNSGDNKEQEKDAPQPVATPTNSPKKNGDQEKQEKVDAEPTTEATTNPTKNEDHKELDMDAARPIAATINGTKEEVNQKMQDKAEAEPTAPTTTYPTDGEDNKQLDIKDAIRPVAAATNVPEKEDDQKKQDKAEAEPAAAITTNPTDGEEKKEQDKDAVRPVTAATNGPKEGDQKKQDKAEAELTAATTTNRTDGEENKELDNDAVRPGAAANNDPRKDHDQNKQVKAKAEEGMAPTTTNPANSGDIKDVARTIIASRINPETSGNKVEAQPRPSPITSSKNTAVEGKPTKFKKLEKLDLRCYRETKAPSWLVPDELENLQKLYIRGGELRFLGPVQENDKWNKVELLGLKFLSDLKMDWKEIRSSFPKLRYMEKFKCPQITFCPCDENGVWLSPPQNEGLQSTVN